MCDEITSPFSNFDCEFGNGKVISSHTLNMIVCTVKVRLIMCVHQKKKKKKKKKRNKETQISRNESSSVYGYLIYDMAFLGIITNGGEKPNIIPEQASLEYLIRTPTKGEICALKERTQACFLAFATATGCEVTIVTCRPHSEHGDVMTWSRLNFLIHA